MRIFRTLMVLLILICLTPPLVLLAAGLIARWSGCGLDPETPLTCKILGGDYGDILHGMARFGWHTVETIPALAALLISWVLIEVVRAMRGPAKPAAQTPTNSRNRARGS
jgi:hypothetical protein